MAKFKYLDVITYNNKTGVGAIDRQRFYPLNIQVEDFTGEIFDIGIGEELKFHVDLRLNNPKGYIKIDGFCVPICTYESLNDAMAEKIKGVNIRLMFNELADKANITNTITNNKE